MSTVSRYRTPIFMEDKYTVYFDVDDTLVMWDVVQNDRDNENIITIRDNYGEISLRPHEAHIEALKQHAHNDHVVVVWSAGGAAWARKVVEVLGLEEYVDVVMSKPNAYYDDLDSTAFMGKPTYLSEKEDGKENRILPTWD